MAQDVNLVQLQNTTDVVQTIWVGDQTINLYAHEVKPFTKEIAEQFLDECGSKVCRYENVVCPIQRPNEPRVWVANMTGDPREPDKLLKVRIEKGQEIPYEKLNPRKVPTVLKFAHSLGDAYEEVGNDETVSYHLGKVNIVLPPYTRYPFAHSIAEFLQVRDGYNEPDHQGKLRLCRAPSDFEPNALWSYEKLRCYAHMVDMRGIDLKLRYPPEASMLEPIELTEAQHALYREIFFRLVDDKYQLPPEAAFHNMWSKWQDDPLIHQKRTEPPRTQVQVVEEPEEEEVVPVPVKRGRGRPKGSKNKKPAAPAKPVTIADPEEAVRGQNHMPSVKESLAVFQPEE